MKKLVIIAALFTFSLATFAQTNPTTSVKQKRGLAKKEAKATEVKTTEVKKGAKGKEKELKVSTDKQTAKANVNAKETKKEIATAKGVVKKDRTPDKRVKENKN